MIRVALSLSIWVAAVACLLWTVGIRQQPTPDQIYGCTVEHQAPNGECK
jgi:hypothetical protein